MLRLPPATAQPDQVAVEVGAALGVATRDGRVVDAEEQPAARRCHFGLALVGRELEQLQRMAVRVLELVGLDAGGRAVVRFGNGLRCARRWLGPRSWRTCS